MTVTSGLPVKRKFCPSMAVKVTWLIFTCLALALLLSQISLLVRLPYLSPARFPRRGHVYRLLYSATLVSCSKNFLTFQSISLFLWKIKNKKGSYQATTCAHVNCGQWNVGCLFNFVPLITIKANSYYITLVYSSNNHKLHCYCYCYCFIFLKKMKIKLLSPMDRVPGAIFSSI